MFTGDPKYWNSIRVTFTYVLVGVLLRLIFALFVAMILNTKSRIGHNDQKPDPERATEPFTTYKEHLRLYIDGARSHGATPVLVTPVHRRYFNEDGTLSDTHGDYVTAVRELAEEANAPLIDLSARTQELYEKLGPEESKELFMWLLPGEYMNFSGGLEDNTHFHENGAVRIEDMVVDAVRELDLQSLRMYLR